MFELAPFGRRNSHLTKRDEVWDLRNFLDSFFNDSFFPVFFQSGQNFMRADVRENDKEYIVDVDLPGVKKEDIKLDLKDDVLTISVEHKEETKEERERYLRRERRYGSYSRSFYVEGVKHEDVKAKYSDGILTITLPKVETQKDNRRNIKIE